jgi:hypothetical protein
MGSGESSGDVENTYLRILKKERSKKVKIYKSCFSLSLKDGMA